MNILNRGAFARALLFAACALVVPALGLSQDTSMRISAIALSEEDITIDGHNFGGSLEVTVGDVRVNVRTSSDARIVTDRPTLAAGVYIVRVARDGGLTPETVASSSLTVPE